MTIADDILTIAKDKLDLGTGPDGRPWALEPQYGTTYLLTHAPDIRALKEWLVGQYAAKHGTVADNRHTKPAVQALSGIAETGGVLADINENHVRVRFPGPASSSTPDTGIDVAGPSGAVAVDGVRTVLARLEGRDDIFLSDVTLTRVVHGEDGRVRLEPMRLPADFATWCAEAGITFWKAGTEVFCPDGWAKQVLRWHRYSNVLPVTGISRIPVIRQDGTLATADGYDAATGLYFDIDEDVQDLDVPDNPSEEDVRLATKYLLDVYAGFEWADDGASRANAIGLLFTVAALKAMNPKLIVPVHAGSAPMQGSGKTVVVAELPGVVAGGYSGLTFTPDDAEVRKRITTEMVRGSERVMCFDNVAIGDTFESGVIAQFITAEWWHDRLLGGNDKTSRPQDRVCTVTGNNLRLGKDMQARTVPIMLEPQTDDPAGRAFEVRLDDAETLRGMRRELLTAILTITRAWVLAGSPQSDAKALRQFTTWARTCGGLLAFIGIEGHLDNLDALREESEDTIALASLYRTLLDHFGGNPFTTEDVVTLVDGDPSLDAALPTWFVKHIVRDALDRLMPGSKASLNRSIGNTFKNRHGEYARKLAVVRAGEDRKGFALWAIRAPGE